MWQKWNKCYELLSVIFTFSVALKYVTEKKFSSGIDYKGGNWLHLYNKYIEKEYLDDNWKHTFVKYWKGFHVQNTVALFWVTPKKKPEQQN